MLGFGGFTSAFVLVVLPKRFVLQSGLVESGITFEMETLPFLPPERGVDIRPTHPMTATPDETVVVGPSEQFWLDALPLLNAREFEAALPVFSDYLADYPDDTDVLREYAVTLYGANRPLDAERVYRQLIEAGLTSHRLELARLLRDRGESVEAIEVFREIVRENPEDSAMRLELARTLLWAERYGEASALYRNLAEEAPRELHLRLELAQALYWNGQAEESFFHLSGYPSHDSAWPSVDSLMNEIVPQVAPRALTYSELIDQAIEAGDLQLATDLYGRSLLRTPFESEQWTEWFNFLQYRLEDLEATRAALIARDDAGGLDGDERFRLAQLHLWTDRPDTAKTELLSLLESDSERPDAWALLGDLYRWEGDLSDARDAYLRTLAIAPANEQALLGMREIRDQVEATIAARDKTGVGPLVSYFRDSDEFTRLDLGVHGAMRWYDLGLSFRTGYRHLDGPATVGGLGSDDGPFAEFEVVRWWRLGTVRTSLTAGVQRLESLGNEPSFNAQVEIPDANGTAVQVSYAHGPAYPHTATLASVTSGIRSDDLQLSAYRGLGEGWSVAGAATVVSLRGAGVDNWRLSGAATATKEITDLFSAGVTTRILTHTEGAPVLDGRRAYWDPSAFWTNSLVLEARTPDGGSWAVFGRFTPGVALARERETEGIQFVPQLGTATGAAYETGRITLESDIAYFRGRAGDYNSFAANLRLLIRP